VLTAALCATAFAAGITGTWSPCGFSMVETLGAAAHRGMRRTTVLACATFAVGALTGGAVTFGALAALGDAAKGVGGAAATTVAVVVAALAALGEMRGVRIVPQIRRQVPEPWRRGLPLPLASTLYGVLLGLGFTTFVLTWAVWALAGISVALGDTTLGVAVGVAFGAGRALPVVAMAPTSWGGAGARLLATMAERPASLRLARGADALFLAACAVLLAAGPAYAAVIDPGGMDPSAAGGDIAWERPGTGGIMETGGHQVVLPGDVPAVGGSLVAWRNGSHVTVATRATLAPVLQFDAAGVDKLAVSDSWVAFRRTSGSRDILEARAIGSPQMVRQVLTLSAPDQIGRPVLDGQRLVFGVVRGTQTSIVSVDLAHRRRQTLRQGKAIQYLDPTLSAGRLLYVKVTRCRQELAVSRPGHDRVLLRVAPIAAQDVGYEPSHTSQGSRRPCPGSPRSPGSSLLGTTALAPGAALVTMLHVQENGALQPSLLSVPR
jgi:hypothetical protein